MNIVEKILSGHLVDGELRASCAEDAGAEIGISIDQILSPDTTGPMIFLQFQAMGLSKIRTKRAVIIVDHQTMQDGFENADDHAFLRSASDKFGAIFSPAGNGICHQILVERFSKPGWTQIGSDSHTPTSGGVGMLSIGAGGLDIAVTMGGGPFYLPRPVITRVLLKNKLSAWAAAKDVALEALRIIGVKGNVGVILEYAGDGVTSLSVPERATICNMGTETGVTTSIFPSDEVTREFLCAQDREDDWVELKADSDASYERTIEIDLATLRPNVARPHSPGNVTSLKELADEDAVKVDQVLIGSCTNSSYRDLMTVAEILKGRKIAPHVSLGVAPGTRQVMRMLAENGALADIVAAGARILESACGFCMGSGQAPRSGGVSVRTSNRNFKGRSGTMDAAVYLVSPESAAIAALTGYLGDPADGAAKLGIEFPRIAIPKKFVIDDSHFQQPTFDCDIVRGPNIGDPPNPPLPAETILGTVAGVYGDNITTDHILPAGGLLKYRSNIAKYSEYVFHQIDPEFPARCHDIAAEGRSAVIVGGASYGQGSSREHAAICPMHLGVRAVAAKGMERIHRANLINFGILPLFFADQADYDGIMPGDELLIENVSSLIDTGKGAVNNITRNKNIPVTMPLSERQKNILRYGSLLRMTREAKQ